jgi:hypothetical protein
MEARWDWSSGKRSTGGASQEREGRVVIVIICVCGAGCLGPRSSSLASLLLMRSSRNTNKDEAGPQDLGRPGLRRNSPSANLYGASPI